MLINVIGLCIKDFSTFHSDKKGKKQATAIETKGKYNTFHKVECVSIRRPKCPMPKNKKAKNKVPKQRNKYLLFCQNKVALK